MSNQAIKSTSKRKHQHLQPKLMDIQKTAEGLAVMFLMPRDQIVTETQLTELAEQALRKHWHTVDEVERKA